MPELIVTEDQSGRRLDAYLAGNAPQITRSMFARLIEDGCVTVNGSAEKASYKVRAGDIISYSVPAPKPAHAQPEEIPLDIVYEDDDLIVIDKPKGMVVHPAPGAREGTLVNALLAHCKGLASVGGVERPGIVHRLDKDTSGVMVVAKNDAAYQSLQKQIQARTAERRYLALVWGDPKWTDAVVDAPIGRHPADRKKMAVIESSAHRSRPAVTELHVLKRLGPMTLIEARLQTGRTHQVRVHSAYAHHPVVGDPVYSGNRRLESGGREFVQEVNRLIGKLHGQALHAFRLGFDHPRTGERMEFTAPLPGDMQALVDFLRRQP